MVVSSMKMVLKTIMQGKGEKAQASSNSAQGLATYGNER